MLDPHPSGPDLRRQSALMEKKKNKINKPRHRIGGRVLYNRGLTGDGVGDRHEGGMQSGGHAPHCVVPHNPRQAKGRDHLGEGCVGRDDSQSQTGGNACGDRAA